MADYSADVARICESFTESMRRDKRVKSLLQKVEEGAATYAEASKLSAYSGRAIARLVTDTLLDYTPEGSVDLRVISAILPPTLRFNYDFVADVAAQVQLAMNKSAGLGLNAKPADYNQSRVDGLITEATGKPDFHAFAPTFEQQIENASMAVVDSSVKNNAAYQYGIGLHPIIRRISDAHCCAWCSNLAGVYPYPDVPEDVYQRHRDCNCVLTYEIGNKVIRRIWG